MTPAGMVDAVLRPRASSLHVRVEEDISGFQPEEWDALLGPDDLLATHRFVRTCQESRIENARYRHAMIRDRHGVAATGSLCAMDFRLDLLAPPWLRAGVERMRVRAPGALRYPLVIAGLPVSFAQSSIRLRPGVDPRPIAGVLHGLAEEFADAVEAPITCFKEFSDDELHLTDGLADRGYVRARSLPSCRLDLRWSSFEEYLAGMRAGYRRQILASLQVRGAAGLRICTVPLDDAMAPRLHGLYGQVMDRAEFQLERLGEDFFAALARNVPESEVILVEREDALLAFALLLHGPVRSTFLLTGIDYAVNRRYHAYLNAVIAVVARCIERGARSIELGQTSWTLKARMGALGTPRHLFLRHRRPLMNRTLHAVQGAFFPRYAVPDRRVFREAVGGNGG